MTTSYDDPTILRLWLNRYPSAHTRSCYQRDSARLLAFLGKPLIQVDLEGLQQFAGSLAGLAPVSQARTIAAVKSLFGFCQRLRHLPYNPAAELGTRTASPSASWASRTVKQVLSARLAPRDRALLGLLYAAGLRVSEACGLRCTASDSAS